MKTYKNPISTAMSEYREDFHSNKEWWMERMGTGNNNEYLWIQFKSGDNITVQSDYFQYDGNTCLPRFRADEVAYISRYFGDQVERFNRYAPTGYRWQKIEAIARRYYDNFYNHFGSFDATFANDRVKLPREIYAK